TDAIGPSGDEHLLFVHWLPSRPRWTKCRTRLPSSRLPWLSAPAGEDPAAGDGHPVQATPQASNSADVAPLLRCDRLRFQLPARQQCVPEGVIGLMHDHAFKTSEDKLALAGVCHGDVGDLFGEADGQANVRAVRRVTQRWPAKPLLRSFPSRAVGRI